MASSLVTGVAGFIGSNLARELLERGHTVRGIDNFETGRRENVSNLRKREAFEFIEADLRDERAIDRVTQGIDFVFHHGAVPSVPRSIANPKLVAESNCLGTTNLLVSARDNGARKVVVASSSSVYGSGGDLPKRVSQPVNPESPYALSKYWTEELAIQFSEIYGLETVALRYFNVFGPGQDPSGDYAAVIPKFIDQMMEGQRPTIYGDGEQSRDFTYIDNAVDANIKAVESDCTGEALNVGCGDRITINELVDHLNAIFGSDIQPIYDEPRPGDVRHSLADISKTKSEIGYEPWVDVKQGLNQTVTFMREE